jgi:osmotically-inducible protein OsmY
MPNRQQNYQSGTSRSGSGRSWDDDDNRSSRDWERDYGQGSDSDEGSQGRQYGQRRDTSEESGSTGRYAGYGNFGQGDYNRRNTGQDRYGQSGYGQGGYGQRGGYDQGGGYGQGNYGQSNYSYGQPSYGQDFGSSGTSNYGRSNFGSGQSERGSEYSRTGSSSGVGYRGYGGEGSYGSQGGWREPSGEGQQYGSSSGSSQGQHRGKGPKNYQRSDERVKEMLCERLHDDPEIDASEVTVSVQGGKITLEGTVDSRRTKNAIEDVAEQMGSQDVQNNLRVQKAGERSGMETGGKSSTATRSSMGTEDGDQSRQKRN